MEDVTGGDNETSNSRVLHKDFNTTTQKVWKPKIHYIKILKYDDNLQEKHFFVVVNCKKRRLVGHVGSYIKNLEPAQFKWRMYKN